MAVNDFLSEYIPLVPYISPFLSCKVVVRVSNPSPAKSYFTYIYIYIYIYTYTYARGSPYYQRMTVSLLVPVYFAFSFKQSHSSCQQQSHSSRKGVFIISAWLSVFWSQYISPCLLSTVVVCVSSKVRVHETESTSSAHGCQFFVPEYVAFSFKQSHSSWEQSLSSEVIVRETDSFFILNFYMFFLWASSLSFFSPQSICWAWVHVHG